MSNILVTGGLGFIGSNFISKILKSNHFIVNIDSKTYASINNSYLQFESYSNYKYYNIDINNIAASAGSACSSGSDSGSHVLKEIPTVDGCVNVRFSFSKYNTLEEVDYVVNKIIEISDF